MELAKEAMIIKSLVGSPMKAKGLHNATAYVPRYSVDADIPPGKKFPLSVTDCSHIIEISCAWKKTIPLGCVFKRKSEETFQAYERGEKKVTYLTE